jgi:hypothetical protein
MVIVITTAATISATPTTHHFDYTLTSEAFILDPVENPDFANLATSLYLNPLGFNGTPVTVIDPEIAGDLNQTIDVDEQDLIAPIEQQFATGTVSATDPIYIFGYSQGAVAASLAEAQLAADGIPSHDLHFVLVGDSASADGGILNTGISSLPPSEQQPIIDLLTQFGANNVIGATTPDNLYPTDVYSLSADGWSNWDNGTNLTNLIGMWTDHLAYLGLTPTEVGSATLSLADNLTNYYVIDSTSIDLLSALWNSLVMVLDGFPVAQSF